MMINLESVAGRPLVYRIQLRSCPKYFYENCSFPSHCRIWLRIFIQSIVFISGLGDVKSISEHQSHNVGLL